MQKLMRGKVWVFASLLIWNPVTASSQSADYHDRRDLVLDQLSNPVNISSFFDSKQLYGYASAAYARGNTTQGNQLVERALDNLGGGAFFRRWQQADVLMRFGDVIDPALYQRLASQAASEPYTRGGTLNHQIMNAAGRYLLGQALGESRINGRNFDPGTGDPTGRQYLLDSAEQFARRGYSEYDSQVYNAFNLGPLKSVADLSTDPVVRRVTTLAYEAVSGAIAPKYLNGHYLASASRDLRPLDARQVIASSEFDGFNWLNFGGVADRSVQASHALAFPSLTDTPLPQIFEDIARDRSQAYTHLSTAAYRDDRPVFQQVYVNQTYGLYSQFEKPGRTQNEFQGRRWAVKWDDEDASSISTFFVTVPDNTFNMRGATRFEKVLQYENTLVAVFNRNSTANPISSVVPDDYLAALDNSSDGRIYLHYGEVMIGVHLSEGFNWNRGDASWSLDVPKATLVIETVLPKEFGEGTPEQQLTRFRSAMTAQSLTSSGLGDGVPTVTYTSLSGCTLSLDNNDNRSINGEPVVGLEDWAQHSGPWIKQEIDGRHMFVEHGGNRRIYDFDNWTVAADSYGRGLQADYDFRESLEDRFSDNDASPYNVVAFDSVPGEARFSAETSVALPTGLLDGSEASLLLELNVQEAGQIFTAADLMENSGRSLSLQFGESGVLGLTVDGHNVLQSAGGFTDDLKIAITWRLDDKIEFYVDGVLLDSATYTGNAFLALDYFNIGADADKTNGFVGELSRLSIFDRQLSLDEILIKQRIVPEPSTLTLLSLPLYMLRRRSTQYCN